MQLLSNLNFSRMTLSGLPNIQIMDVGIYLPGGFNVKVVMKVENLWFTCLLAVPFTETVEKRVVEGLKRVVKRVEK